MDIGSDKKGLIYGVNGAVSAHSTEFICSSLYRAPLSIHPQPLSAELFIKGSRGGDSWLHSPSREGALWIMVLLWRSAPWSPGLSQLAWPIVSVIRIEARLSHAFLLLFFSLT